MTVRSPDPFDALLKLQHALERSTGDDPLGGPTSGAGPFPAVNVFQKWDDFVVIAELPGLDKDSLTIEVRRHQLRLAGERAAVAAEGMSIHRRERAVGKFDRTFELQGSINADAASASYQDGMLTVTLPHAEETKPKAIKVT